MEITFTLISLIAVLCIIGIFRKDVDKFTINMSFGSIIKLIIEWSKKKATAQMSDLHDVDAPPQKSSKKNQ